MSTFIYLLVALIVLFAITKIIVKQNKIDAFNKLVASLCIGLFLGAGVNYYVEKTSDTSEKENTAISCDSIPTYQSICNYANTDMGQDFELYATPVTEVAPIHRTIERDIQLIQERKEDLRTTRCKTEIEDDS